MQQSRFMWANEVVRIQLRRQRLMTFLSNTAGRYARLATLLCQ